MNTYHLSSYHIYYSHILWYHIVWYSCHVTLAAALQLPGRHPPAWRAWMLYRKNLGESKTLNGSPQSQERCKLQLQLLQSLHLSTFLSSSFYTFHIFLHLCPILCFFSFLFLYLCFFFIFFLLLFWLFSFHFSSFTILYLSCCSTSLARLVSQSIMSIICQFTIYL